MGNENEAKTGALNAADKAAITTPITEPSAEDNESKQEVESLKSLLTQSLETIANRDQTIADLKIKNERLMTMIGAKQPEAKEAEKPKRTRPEVEIDGRNYRFRFGAFAFKGIHYEASDVAIDEKLLKEILADKGQSILKQIF